MADFVSLAPNGQFTLAGRRWFCNSVIYYGRFPGACGPDWWRDGRWELFERDVDRDFANMAEVGINHAAMFFHNDMFFANGQVSELALVRMDRIVAAAKAAGVRISIFIGPFIDSPAVFEQITGERWVDDDCFLPSFNPRLHDAYVRQMLPFAERYRNEPTVLAYTDRIDRFHKGFDNVTIPFNLKAEWHAHLRQKFGRFKAFVDAMGGAEVLENRPTDYHQVLLPQESKWNASLRNPLGYEYILWQKQVIGAAQARFDAAINQAAPHQFVWTPFEGNTNTWAMLDGFSPETKQLQAIWMEYYFFEMTRPSYVQPFEEWPHTRELHHSRLSHQLPVIYNAAYAMCRYLKLAVQRPVVICHGAWTDSPAYGTESYEQQVAILDRVNAACLAADGDGWHYWNWRDDQASWFAHQADRRRTPTQYYFPGESLGLNEFDGQPKPALALAAGYSRQLARRAAANPPVKRSDVLLLSSAPRMYSLFRRLALPTAAAVNGALTRLGVHADYRWTAQNAVRLRQATLDRYKLIAIADNLYERDFRDTPAKLLRYVERGGTLYLPLDRWDSFKDEHGVAHANAALTRLSGVDPSRAPDWPGARDLAVNWPFTSDPAAENPADSQGFPRVQWGVCPAFRQFAAYPERLQLLGFRSTDDDTFTAVPGLVAGAEVIAVAKFPSCTRPLYYRHRLGQGMVYVNAWTNNLYRDNEQRQDYGGWDYDWLLDLALASSGARDVDLTAGASLWLRNTWGYFWPQQ
jgi:hypothetical protein